MYPPEAPARQRRTAETLLGIGGLLAVALIGAADLTNNARGPTGLLQLLVVMAVTWRAGTIWGLLGTTVAAVFVLIPGFSPVEAMPFRWPQAVFRVGALGIAVVLVARLQIATDRLRELAATDPLTGLGNRALFLDRAAAELNRSRRLRHSLTVAYLDVDDFKSLNDTHGHLAGDRVLIAIGKTISGQIRNYDVAARLGGDEFALLLPETDAAAARIVIERLHDRLTDTLPKCTATATISIGAATFEELPETVEELLHAADQTMYAAKRAGKACVRCVVVAAAQTVEKSSVAK